MKSILWIRKFIEWLCVKSFIDFLLSTNEKRKITFCFICIFGVRTSFLWGYELHCSSDDKLYLYYLCVLVTSLWCTICLLIKKYAMEMFGCYSCAADYQHSSLAPLFEFGSYRQNYTIFEFPGKTEAKGRRSGGCCLTATEHLASFFFNSLIPNTVEVAMGSCCSSSCCCKKGENEQQAQNNSAEDKLVHEGWKELHEKPRRLAWPIFSFFILIMEQRLILQLYELFCLFAPYCFLGGIDNYRFDCHRCHRTRTKHCYRERQPSAIDQSNRLQRSIVWFGLWGC